MIRLLDAIDFDPVDPNNQIIRLNPGRLSGAAYFDTVYYGQENGATVHIENAGENDDRQNEIGNGLRQQLLLASTPSGHKN
jgi:hypothetical protein